MRNKTVTKKEIEDIISRMRLCAENAEATSEGVRIMPKGDEFIAEFNILATYVENSQGKFDTSLIPSNIRRNVLRMSNGKLGELSRLSHSLKKEYDEKKCNELEKIMEDIIQQITQI